ncbi:N-acetylglucosaminyl-diphospho-decaprenol L-rhamnosyltransferase [compost metagenome]
MSRVSILIVTWNSEETIVSCLSSVPADAEVVVFDNASSDGTVALVKQAFPAVTVVESAANLGFGTACNMAAQHAHGRYYLLLNPDAALHPEAIDSLCGVLDAEPACGGVGPRILNAEGDLELSWDRWLTPAQEWIRRGNHAGKRKVIPPATRCEVDWISGACILLRAESWQQVGGFDPEFFLYFEDADLCRRLTQAGWSIQYEPAAKVTHLKGRSSNQIASRVELWYRMGQLRYYAKHNPLVDRLLLRAYLFAKYARRAMRGDVYARRIMILALGVAGRVRVT